ncbi:hypothetical protein HD806DRAFT_505228 [Xylariaceae sp. AK1471]|nr:hypothetical protein HD806DRAFT_505228 [Xylariaceae sp. AK1471]
MNIQPCPVSQLVPLLVYYVVFVRNISVSLLFKNMRQRVCFLGMAGIGGVQLMIGYFLLHLG